MHLEKNKIGLVLSQTPAYSETFFISKIEGLQKVGYDVTLFVQAKDPKFSLCKVKVAPKVYKINIFLQFYSLLFVSLKLLIHPKRLQKFIKLERAEHRSWKQIFKNGFNNSHILTANLDWLHFGFATIALQSEHVAKVIGAKMAVSFRGFDMAIYPVLHNNCYNLLWKNIDKIHTISNDLIQIAYQLGLNKNVSYQKITPAIDMQKFVANNKNQNFDKKHLHITTIARLHWKKGIINTLLALAKIKLEGINFSYNIIGEGGEFENIAFAIHQLKLQNNVKLCGRKEPNEIVQLLKQSDIHIQYSISEGFCNSLLEAQAMGLLCIASDAEGLSENVIHNKTGWIVEKRNPKALAETIKKVIHLSKEEKNKIIICAKERITKEFNIKKQQQEFLKFYE